ncbi:MAG: hypothetical protein WDM78_06040 [Puia sp.]
MIKTRDLSQNKDKPLDDKISGTPGQKTNNKTSVKSESPLNPPSGVASTVPVITGKTKADKQTGSVSAQKTLPDNDVNRNILLSGIQTDVASQSASTQSKKNDQCRNRLKNPYSFPLKVVMKTLRFMGCHSRRLLKKT